jgi:hypothetical protein
MYSCSLTGKLSNCKRFPSSLDQQCAGGMLASQGPENRGVLTFGVQSTCPTSHNTRCEYKQLRTQTGEEYWRVVCHRGRSVPGDNRATDNDWIHSKHAECLPALRCGSCTNHRSNIRTSPGQPLQESPGERQPLCSVSRRRSVQFPVPGRPLASARDIGRVGRCRPIISPNLRPFGIVRCIFRIPLWNSGGCS